MKNLFAGGLASALCLGVGALQAQDAASVQELQKQLREMQNELKSLRQEVRELRDKDKARAPVPEDATPRQTAVPNAGAAGRKPASAGDPIRLGSGLAWMDLGLVGTFAEGGSTASDIAGGLNLGGHDPNQRGFSVQGVEASFTGAVDPYFRGAANLTFGLDAGGETFVELEEAYLESTSLPGNLQLRAGQFLTEFGRHNPTHLHSWGFVDGPLVTSRFLGPDGLRNPGARLSWLVPAPFYSELFLTVQNSGGATANGFRSGGHSHGGAEEAGIPFAFRHPDNDRGVRGLADLLFSARYAASFDLNNANTLLAGFSGALGPNSSGLSGGTRTEIYGADLTWKWKPETHSGGFPFVSFTAEAMLRRYQAGLFDWDEDANLGDGDGNGFPDAGVLVDATGATPSVLAAETLTDYGFYAQLLYGFRKGWVAGLRFDHLDGNRASYERQGFRIADNAGGGDAATDLFRARRWRVSPNLTWFPSEFSKIRLQYNYDDREGPGVDHSVWLQFEFSLGAHAAHRF